MVPKNFENFILELMLIPNCHFVKSILFSQLSLWIGNFQINNPFGEILPAIYWFQNEENEMSWFWYFLSLSTISPENIE